MCQERFLNTKQTVILVYPSGKSRTPLRETYSITLNVMNTHQAVSKCKIQRNRKIWI